MFRRGFKSWAEGVSAKTRADLALAPDAPLDPAALAAHLNVPILGPHELPGLAPDPAQRLISNHREEWSAITVSGGGGALIIVNPAHAATRRHSSLAHELAHLILGHEPSVIFIAPGTGTVLRTHNRNQEDEAAWLSGALLLPRPALLAIRRRRLTEESACAIYLVSPAMLRYRLNATGVDLQLRRAQGRATTPPR